MTITQNPTYNKQKASAFMQKGRLQEALKLLQKFCLKQPGDAEAFYLLGNCNGMLGRYQDAIDALEKSLHIQPHVAQSHFAIGGALKMLNRLEEAAEHFRIVLKSNPRMAEAHLALADILSTLGQISEASQHYEKARDIQPASGAAHLGLGIIAEREGLYEKSLSHFQQAVKREPQSPRYLCALGSTLFNLKQWQEARGIYRKALSIAPEYPDALGGLAGIYDITGDYKKSIKQIEPLLKKNIYSIPAGVAFLHICKHLGRCEEAVDYAQSLLDKNPGIAPNSRLGLHMATARALDHMERYDEAFTHFKAGNEASIQDMDYDPVRLQLSVNKIIEAFNIDTFIRLPRARIKTNRPIFILGMPRSGTSLTEQILATHPQVEGAGELPYLSDMMKSLPNELGSSKIWPECIEDFKQDTMDKLSRWYLDRLRGVSKKARRVTDKMPHNFYVLGLIQLLFPEAHVIHCRRDPMDTCLSIYFQNFQVSHPYAQDLFKLGTHYRQYQQLMEHWKQVLSIPVFEIHYEKLVNEPEPSIRQMLEFCGLEWDDNCLQFHKLERKVDTASYDQVRQPLYTRSVQRWRHYENHLDELKKGLERGY